MFSIEEKARALATLKKNGGKVTATIRELGYPSRATMKRWRSERDRAETASAGAPAREVRYSEEQAREAVSYYLEHGKSASATIRALGYPKSRRKLCDWIDEYAPGKRRRWKTGAKSETKPLRAKAHSVSGPEVTSTHDALGTSPLA